MGINNKNRKAGKETAAKVVERTLAELGAEKGPQVPLVGVSVAAEVAGSFASVRLRQRFVNNEKIAVEAVYKFPLPADCAVCGFKIETGGKIIDGAVEEREKAFDLYDKALEKGNSAYLADQERPNLFTLMAGNLVPGQEAVVELQFVTRLEYRGEELRLTLPSAIGPRYVPPAQPDKEGIPVSAQVNPPFALSVPYGMELRVNVRGRGSVESVNCHSHRVKTDFAGDDLAVSLSSGLVPMDRDFVLDLKLKDGDRNRAVCFSDGKYSYVGVDFGYKAPATKAKTEVAEMIFVLDCSGSMDGDSITQSKAALEILLKALEPGRPYNIYRFGSSFEKLFVSPRRFDQESFNLSLQWLRGVHADLGGTELLGPLRDIYAKSAKSREVVVLTDGDIGNESDIAGLASAPGSAGTRLHLVGIGNGPNEHLLKSASRAGHGLSLMIAPGERIEPPLLRFYGALRNGCLTDVSVKCGASTGESAGVPSALFAGSFDPMYLRLSGKPGASVEISGKFNGKAVAYSVKTEQVSENCGLPALWARARIRELEAACDTAGAIKLAKEYCLASSFTSFVGIQERGKARRKGEIVQRAVPVLPPAGWGALECEEMITVQNYSSAYLSCMSKSAVPSRAVRKRMSPKARMCFDMEMDSAELVRSVSQKIQQDNLMDILSAQRYNGGFERTPAIYAALGFSASSFDKAMASQPAGVKEAVFGAVVLRLLEKRFGARRSEWEPLVQKTVEWLDSLLKGAPARIEGKPIADWARAWADKLK